MVRFSRKHFCCVFSLIFILLHFSCSCLASSTVSVTQHYTKTVPPTLKKTNSIASTSSSIIDNSMQLWNTQAKEDKMLYSNLAAASVIGVWGLMAWDYGSGSIHSANEGWFQQDTKYGGADKLGHFWATYTLADAFTGIYKHWGYDATEANGYGALSAWTIQAAMEFMDGTSRTQGFSWEDIVMNSLGAMTSVLFEHYPALDNKIDFRVEYTFNVDVNNIFDDYSNHFYAIVFKLDGFETIRHPILRLLELHGGYYTRGYEDKNSKNSRHIYAGISINFSKLLRERNLSKTSKVLEYLQIPYTVPKISHGLD